MASHATWCKVPIAPMPNRRTMSVPVSTRKLRKQVHSGVSGEFFLPCESPASAALLTEASYHQRKNECAPRKISSRHKTSHLHPLAFQVMPLNSFHEVGTQPKTRLNRIRNTAKTSSGAIRNMKTTT